jgi:hypothetical protein
MLLTDIQQVTKVVSGVKIDCFNLTLTIRII